LKADFAATSRNIRLTSTILAGANAHAVAILPYLKDPALEVRDTIGFLASLYNTTRKLSRGVQQHTYDELRTTGSLRLLDPGERAAIADYYGWIDVTAGSWLHDVSEHRDYIRRLIPPDAQRAIRQSCPAGETKPFQCPAKFDITDPDIMKEVRGNREVIGNVVLYIQQMDLWLADLGQAAERTRRVSAAFD
jgi:hypothetical protein